MTAPVVDRIDTIDFDKVFGEIADNLRADEERRLRAPLVRLWDGDWNLRGLCTQENAASFQLVDNETGIGTLELPEGYYLSDWLVDVEARGTTNVFITVDKDGLRWSGMMDEFELVHDEIGRSFVKVIFKHDYEHLKHILAWSNPWLPAEVQFPKIWLAFGSAKFVCKTTLLANIMRLESSAWMLPDNPLDASQWFNFNQSTWSMVVKPSLPGEVDRTLPALCHSRFKTVHEATRKIVTDGQLSWVCRRYLEGDPPPWPGANLRHGCLVWDLVDKSGFNSGTAFRGDIFGGLIHELVNIGGDGLTQNVEQIPDPNVPEAYFKPNNRGTHPSMPGVVFYESEKTGTFRTSFKHRPATDVQSVAGGSSAPGVNELIKATVTMIGDLTAMIPGVPPLGGVADALLAPLYCVAGDTVIDGPDGKERIDALAERGGPFRVWSITPDGQQVPARAALAFKKGHTELFKYRLANGRTLTATAHHRWLTRDGWAEAKATPIGAEVATVADGHDSVPRNAPREDLPDESWNSVAGPAIEWSPVVSVESVGSQDFYDMTVPGWVNYAGNGIWNHNTDVFFAFGAWKSPQRAQRLGWSHYHERFATGADKAYTLAYVIAQRAAMYESREQTRCTLTVTDGSPWRIGEQGYGDFSIGDRVGFTIRGPKSLYGRIFVEQVSELVLAWDRKSTPAWQIKIGSREPEDPVLRAFQDLQDFFGILQDLGVF